MPFYVLVILMIISYTSVIPTTVDVTKKLIAAIEDRRRGILVYGKDVSTRDIIRLSIGTFGMWCITIAMAVIIFRGYLSLF